jgi:hypothetical protein
VEQALLAANVSDSDEALVCKVLSTCMGALSALALSPDTVTLPSHSESSLDKLSMVWRSPVVSKLLV